MITTKYNIQNKQITPYRIFIGKSFIMLNYCPWRTLGNSGHWWYNCAFPARRHSISGCCKPGRKVRELWLPCMFTCHWHLPPLVFCIVVEVGECVQQLIPSPGLCALCPGSSDLPHCRDTWAGMLHTTHNGQNDIHSFSSICLKVLL